MPVGYIYILSNSAMGRLLKIGYSTVSVEGRAEELARPTGVPGPYAVEYVHISEDAEQIEALVHAELADRRYNPNREFFETSISDAVAAIRRHIRMPAISFQRPSESAEAKTPCRRCGLPYAKSATLQQLCPKCGF